MRRRRLDVVHLRRRQPQRLLQRLPLRARVLLVLRSRFRAHVRRAIVLRVRVARQSRVVASSRPRRRASSPPCVNVPSRVALSASLARSRTVGSLALALNNCLYSDLARRARSLARMRSRASFCRRARRTSPRRHGGRARRAAPAVAAARRRDRRPRARGRARTRALAARGVRAHRARGRPRGGGERVGDRAHAVAARGVRARGVDDDARAVARDEGGGERERRADANGEERRGIGERERWTNGWEVAGGGDDEGDVDARGGFEGSVLEPVGGVEGVSDGDDEERPKQRV